MSYYTKDIIESVVTSMKSSGSITSISETSDVWTIMTSDTGNLQNGYKVKIGSNYLRVSNVTWNSFKVETTADLSAETSWEMYINFLFGSKIEISNAMIKEYTNTTKSQKFDAIWLLNILEEDAPAENELIERVDQVTIAIVTDTLFEYTSEQKLTNIFKVRLNPLFELFKKELSKSSYIILNRGENLDIKAIQVYNYYSNKDKKNVLNEYADAIELVANINIKKVFDNENVK